jgi:protein O-mannosyl-transferase
MIEAQTTHESNVWEPVAKYFRRPAVLLPVILLATGVLYSGTLFFEFVWDDGPQIVNNPLIRSWAQMPRAFVSDLWFHAARQQVYYRPLFVVWSILNYAVVGLRPWGWHLGAILLHLGATLAVYWLSRRLGLEYWTAALATLIFALHPVHIECVAWISAGSDSMVTMLSAFAFAAFLKGRAPDTTRRLAWHLASMVLLACALLTKEMAASFTLLVGMYIWLFSKGSGAQAKLKEALAAMLPYGAVTACYVLARKMALWHSHFQFDAKHSFGDVALTLPYVLAVYLRQLLLPVGLTGLYYTPYLTGRFFTHLVLPLFVLSAAAGLIYYWVHKTGDRVVAFAGIWLVVSLAPVLYLRNFGNGDFVRDRYMYLPSIGFAILVAKCLRLLPSLRSWSSARVQGFAALALCGAYVGVSIPQQTYWASDLLVTYRGHQLYPDNTYASIGLAREYSIRGAHERAIPLVEDAVKGDAENTYAAFALAEVYIAAGRNEEGRRALEYALRITPGYAESETGLASIAALWGKLGDYERANDLCRQALALDPRLYSALYNCGNIELVAGHYVQAQRLLARAVEVAPDLAAPRHFLGRALLLQGRNTEARPYLLQAVTMDPRIYDYHYWLGQSFEKTGNVLEARREYSTALLIVGDREEVKARLAALDASKAINVTK